MKKGTKLICIKETRFLIKGETYFFDQKDLVYDDVIFVRSKNNYIYYGAESNFKTIKQIRTEKLLKLNRIR